MKNKFLLTFIVATLTSCNTNTFVLQKRGFLFNTPGIDLRLYEGKEENLKDIWNLLSEYDVLTDNYQQREVNNVYTINNSNEDVTVDEKLYSLLTIADSVSKEYTYYDYLCGSLSKKWKESLKNKQELPSNVIQEELEKMNNTSLSFKENNVIQRVGSGEIDLGGIAKGYALDKALDYLKEKELKHYLLNLGSSSILLGEKTSDNGYFTIELEDMPSKKFKLKNCFLSTSSITHQGVTIGDKTYSHIVNPLSGSVLNLNDTVIVVTSSGYLGDVLSTSMMNNTIEEIEAIEQAKNIKTIVIRNKTIVHNTIEG